MWKLGERIRASGACECLAFLPFLSTAWPTGTLQQDTGRKEESYPRDMNKTESQKKQRRRQNGKAALRRIENVEQGFCGCGKERENTRWKLCVRCR